MKTLLSFALCLLSIVGFAATPSTKSFRGTGGILVTSNDTTGLVTIDGGSVVAGGTNSTIRISTNTVLLTVATQLNFGASITGVVAGSTVHVGVNGASSDFTNAVNTLITNVLQSSTNSFGNAITNLVWNKTIFVDSSGNDTTGRRGDATKPFATVSNAFKVIQNGDTVLIRPGEYNANGVGLLTGSIGLTNLTNVSIVGSGSATILTNGALETSMLVIWGCSNIVLQDFTMRGVLTNGVVNSHAAVWEGGTNIGVKFLNMSFINWQNQGIGDLGQGAPGSTRFVFQNCLFDTIGGTNHTPGGVLDGTSIGNVRSGDIVANCTFINCLRCMESYESGVPDGVVFVNNVAKNIYGSAINMGGSNNVNWIIANNSFSARTNLTSESAWLVAFSSTRSVIVNNNVQGFENVLIWDSQANSTTFSDNLIAGNVFRNARQGIFAGQAVLNKLCERNAYLNNKFIHIGFTGMGVGGNGTRIEGNEFYDVGTNASSGYAIDLGNVGYSGAALTNFSNVTIKDNIIGNSTATAITDGSIRISAKATNTIVLGNRILAGSAISDAGVNTLGFDYVRLGADNLTATNFGIWAHPAGGTLDVSSQRGTFYAYSPNGDPLTNFNFGLFGGPGLRSMGNGFKVIDIANDPALGSFEAVSVFTKTNRVTNSLVVAYGSPAAGQILTSVGTDGAVNWSNAPAGGSGGGASTNDNQFGAAGAVLTIKTGARMTNLLSQGNFTVTGSQTNTGLMRVSAGFYDNDFGNNLALISSGSRVIESAVTGTELGLLSGITLPLGNVRSNVVGGITAIGVSTNLSDLWVLSDLHANDIYGPFVADRVLISGGAGALGLIEASTVTTTELGFLSGVTGGLATNLNAKMDENNGVSTNQTTHQTLTVQNIRAQPFITLPASLHFDGTNQMQRTNAITGTKTIQLTNLTADVDYILEVDATGATATDLVVNFTGYSGVGPALTNNLTTYLIQKRGTTTNITRMISDSALLAERTVVTNVISLSSSNATSKPLTNSFTAGILKLYGLEAGAFTTITPNGSNYVIASTGGGGVTALSNLTDVVVTNMETGAVLTWISAMGKWTNITPFYTYNIYVTTNIYLGTNFEQSISVTTNLPFKLFFEGTPRNGDVVHVSVSNYSASTIYATNTFFDTTVASNVSYWAIPALSIRKITFVNTTNHNLGVNRWELMTHAMKESELAVAGGLTMHTNVAQSIITLSNSGTFPLTADGNAAGFAITNIGKLGLGTTAPSATQTPMLRFGGTNSAGVAVTFDVGLTNNLLTFLSSGAVPAMTIASNGAVSVPVFSTSAGNITAAFNIIAGSVSTLGFSGLTTMSSIRDGVLAIHNNGQGDLYGLSFGLARSTNGLIQSTSTHTGNSNGTFRLVSANTNVHWSLQANDIGTFRTNWTADATSFVGYTNLTGYNQIWNIRGTSGNIVFWNRTGPTSGSLLTNMPAGIAIWTNTIIASGSDIVVGVNCGIAIDTGVGVVGGGRAF